jgi:hypothetical protein
MAQKKDWYAKYYPIKANDPSLLKPTVDSLVKAIDHSIQKWKGFNAEDKPDEFEYDAESCTLCLRVKYIQVSAENRHAACCRCPLFQVGAGCDNPGSPYQNRYEHGGQSMIDALKQAKKFVLNEKEKFMPLHLGKVHKEYTKIQNQIEKLEGKQEKILTSDYLIVFPDDDE